jgi:hypothetical protein
MRGTWQGSGTWQTSGGSGPVLLVIGALIVLGSGAAAAIAAAVIVTLIAAGAVIVLTLAGLAAYLICRARRGRSATPLVRRFAPSDVMYRLDAPGRPALEQPREIHLHFHGTDPEKVAEILRRHGEDY